MNDKDYNYLDCAFNQKDFMCLYWTKSLGILWLDFDSDFISICFTNKEVNKKLDDIYLKLHYFYKI